MDRGGYVAAEKPDLSPQRWNEPSVGVAPVRDSRRPSVGRNAEFTGKEYLPLRDERAVHDAVEILNASSSRRGSLDIQQKPPLPPVSRSTSSAPTLPLQLGYAPQPPPASQQAEAEGPLLRAFRSGTRWEAEEAETAIPTSMRLLSPDEPARQTSARRPSLTDGRIISELGAEYAEFESDITDVRNGEAGPALEDLVAGEADAPQGKPTPTTEDLCFEISVLKEKLVEERAKAQRAQDKLYFLLLKVKGKDELIASLKNSLRQRSRDMEDKESQLSGLTSQKSQMQRRLDNMQAHVHQLEFDKFKLLNPSVKATDGEQEVVHRAGVQKAKMLLAHQLFKQQADKKIEELKVENVSERKRLRRKLQCHEQELMAFEDEYAADTMHSLMRTLRFGQAQTADEQRRQVQRELRFERRISLASPDDEHVAALLGQTHYGQFMPQCKSELGSSVKDLKETIDKSLQTLWLLFNERTTSSSSRIGQQGKPPHRIADEFFQCVDQTLMRTKQMVADFGRKSNAFLRAFCKMEKDVTVHIRNTRYASTDQGCQVEARPDTPVEVYELRDEITHYQRRLRQLSQDHAEKEHQLEMRAGKAESSLEYLQRHVLSLHRSLFTSLHLIFKHRFRWCNRLPDPMRNIHVPEGKDRRKIFEVSYNMKLGELMQVDRDYMDKFGRYMISEDFGSGGVSNKEAHGHRPS